MKIQELFQLDKSIAKKKQELEELKLILEVMKKENSEDSIDINDVYIFKSSNSNTKYFCHKVFDYPPYRNIKLIDIFSNKVVRVYHSFGEFVFNRDEQTHIRDVLPEVNVYPTGKVPKILLQKLYYRVNGIDEKVLKRGTLKEDE